MRLFVTTRLVCEMHFKKHDQSALRAQKRGPLIGPPLFLPHPFNPSVSGTLMKALKHRQPDSAAFCRTRSVHEKERKMPPVRVA